MLMLWKRIQESRNAGLIEEILRDASIVMLVDGKIVTYVGNGMVKIKSTGTLMDLNINDIQEILTKDDLVVKSGPTPILSVAGCVNGIPDSVREATGAKVPEVPTGAKVPEAKVPEVPTNKVPVSGGGKPFVLK